MFTLSSREQDFCQQGCMKLSFVFCCIAGDSIAVGLNCYYIQKFWRLQSGYLSLLHCITSCYSKEVLFGRLKYTGNTLYSQWSEKWKFGCRNMYYGKNVTECVYTPSFNHSVRQVASCLVWPGGGRKCGSQPNPFIGLCCSISGCVMWCHLWQRASLKGKLCIFVRRWTISHLSSFHLLKQWFLNI